MGAKYNYDQSGGTFYYFIISLLSVYLVPTTISYLRHVFGKISEDIHVFAVDFSQENHLPT